MSTFTVDALAVVVSSSRVEMGQRAGAHATNVIEQAISHHGEARIILASAPSQNETLDALLSASVDWSRVTIFHMDEYLGLPENHPQTFRSYQQRHVLSRAHGATFFGIRGEAADPAAECVRYGAMLAEGPIHLCCLGIGENGHLAFNDPPVANFEDRPLVKVVELDAPCRQQQVNDGCFPTFTDVPTHALTLTIPALLRAEVLVGSVPGPRKAEAVHATLRGPISTACPASILRRHSAATLYLDKDSAARL
jgi:glucosamine-6-phosphate deaminase